MEFVSQSSFWSFNHVFQFNGTEAALVFPRHNARLLVLFNASIHSKKACNQTCRILETQLLTPQWGIAQMRYLFLPALTFLKPVGFPAHQKALLLAHQLSPLLPHKKIAWDGRNRLTTYNPPVQHTGSVVCISVTQNRGWVLVFQTARLDRCEATPELNSNDQFLILDQVAPKLLFLDNSKIKNLSLVSYNLPNFNRFG